MLNESFEKLESDLCGYGLKFVGEMNNYRNRLDYHYGLWFVSKNPMEIQAGNVVVTKKNMMIFVVGFIIVKFFAYIIDTLRSGLV